MASLGNIHKDVVLQFCDQKYFFKPYPKSLNRLTFIKFIENKCFNEMNNFDALLTLNEITVQTILKSISILPKYPKLIVLMGGGVKNFAK